MSANIVENQLETHSSMSAWKIRHENSILDKIAALHLDENSADIFLLVENGRLPAHKAILLATYLT